MAGFYDDIRKAVRFPGTLTFWYASALQFSDALAAELKTELAKSASDLRWIDVSNPEAVGTLEAPARDAVVVLTGWECLLSDPRQERVLTDLRSPIEAARERGDRILCLSKAPLSRFKSLVGSSILLDARPVRLDSLSDEDSFGYLKRYGVVGAEAKRVAGFADGHRALLHEFAEVETSSDSGNVKKRRAVEAESDIASRVFAQLGPNYCAWLDYWIFEQGSSEIRSSEGLDVLLNVLRQAGVVRLRPDHTLELLPFKNREVWRSVLGDALSSFEEPMDSWMEIVRMLYSYERRLRNLISRELGTPTEGLLATALSTHATRVIELFEIETMVPGRSIEQIRNPLEWLTLSELFDIAMTADEQASSFAGCKKRHWAKMASDLVPIRNRVAHMRLARDGDLDRVRSHYATILRINVSR